MTLFFFLLSFFLGNGIIRLRLRLWAHWAEAGVEKGVAESLPSPLPGLYFLFILLELEITA